MAQIQNNLLTLQDPHSKNVKEILVPFKDHKHIASCVEASTSWALFLPQETLLHLFAFLSPHDLCIISSVCKEWDALSRDEGLWQRFFPVGKGEGQQSWSWRAAYLNLMRNELKADRGGSPIWLRDDAYYGTICLPAKRIGDDEDPYLFKVLIVGDSQIGKTSLIRRYVYNAFNRPRPFVVDFATMGMEVNGKEVVLQLWTLAKPKPFENIPKVYYHAVSGVFLCYDVSNRASWESLKHFWLKGLKEELNLNQVVLFVLGLKADIIEDKAPHLHPVKKEEVLEFCLENGVSYCMETSSKTSQNINDAMSAMAAELLKTVAPIYLPDRGTWATWVKVKEEREKKANSIISAEATTGYTPALSSCLLQ